MPSSLAQICASAVHSPCPIAAAPVKTLTAAGRRHPHQAGFEGAAPGALDAVGEAHADIASACARLRLPARKVGPAGGRQHVGLAGRIVAAVILHVGAGARLQRFLVGHLFRRNEVAAAQLGAVEMELARQAVHQPLHREGRLRIAGAAHRGDRRLVGGRDRHLHGERRDHIGAGQRGGGVVGQVDVLQRIGAEIVQQAAANAEHLALRIGRDVDRPVLIALLHRIGEMLAPVLDPFERALEQFRRRHHRDVLRIDAELGTKAAPDIGRRHPQARLLDIEQHREGLAQVMGLLGRGPDGERLVGAAELDQEAAALDRMGGAAMLPEILVQHMGGLAEGRLGIPIGDPVGRDDVGFELAAHGRRIGLRGLAAVGGRRQRLVIDLDQGGGVLGEIAVVRDHERDRLAHVGDLAVGEREGPHPLERRSGVRVPQHAPLRHDRGQIVEREHGMDARRRQGGGFRERADERMGMRAAHERHVQDARQHDVVDETSAPAQQGVVLEPGNARSDQR